MDKLMGTRSPLPPLPQSLLLVVALAGCGQTPATLREPDDYLGCATDENWRTFDDNELTGRVKTDDTQAVLITAPSPGAALPAATRPTFTWQISPTVTGKPNGDASCPTDCTLTPMTLCGQHMAAVSGDVYDLQFSTEGVLHWRTLTSLQSYTPSDQAWAVMRGRMVSLHMVSMNLKVNEVQSGPYSTKAPFTFTVGN